MSTKQTITIDVELLGKVDSFSNSIKTLQSELGKLSLGKGLTEGFKSSFATITNELEKIQNIAAKKKISVVDDKQIQKSLNTIETAYASVLNKLESEGINTSFLKQDKKAIEALTKASTDFAKQIASSKKEQDKLNKSLEEALKLQEESATKQKKIVSSSEYSKKEADVAAKKAAQKKAQREADKAYAVFAERVATDPKYSSTEEKNAKLTDQGKAYARALKEATEAAQNLAKAEKELNNITTLEKQQTSAKEISQKVEEARQKLQQFNQTTDQTNSTALEEIKQNLLAIKDIDWSSLGINISSINSVEQLNEALIKLSNEAGQRTNQTLSNINTISNQTSGGLNNLRSKTEEYTKALQEMIGKEQEIQGIKSRITHFFGLANAINLARRAMRQAFNAVKELDAAMTETAVVTDFSVGDMWDQLPRYTEAANKLGATTLGAYQTMTLFYQQGLDTSEAFALGTETMKMARIAGLDYADATDKMTAALRGFNMELSEASAQRVNDVYSELAAITAADTEEIANAMTKTASIAHNANMEFETTAAFLSQIIETTRESAETAGTAMKTVIARFQELKKDPSEIGEVDGEIVDANKIETALRSVGVALRDSTGQFRDLDDVFLELASKWDGLDTNTQRYIATIAAGSRQQSRFIAMMSNYERTIELVNAANNSAGASQNQFNKTLDSLEAKLNSLKTAWDEFTMGITNNQAIKFGVDALTWLLNIVNKLTGVAGNEGIGGLITAISKLALAWTALRAGKAVLAGLSTSLSKAGVEAGVSMSRGIRDGFAAEFGKKAKELSKIATINPVIQTKAMTEYQTQMKMLTAEQAKQNAIVMSNTASFTAKKQATAASTQATLDMMAAERAYYTQLGLSNTQTEAAIALSKLDISMDQAALLAKNNITEAQLREAAATKLGVAADSAEAASEAKVMAAEEARRIQSQKGLMLKLQELVFTKMGIISNKALAWSEKLVEKGMKEKNAQMLISLGIMGLIIAAVIGLIALIILLAKHLKSISPEGKLKAAEEAAEKASEQVEKLNEEFNTLKESLDSVAEKRAALDELTYGTQEWRNAVREVNNEMLKIAQLDPDLAPFITNNNGVLEFDYNKTNYKGQTYDDVMEQKQVDLETAQQIDIGSKIEVEYGEIDKERATNTSGIQVGADYGVADPGLQYISGQTLSEEYVSQMNEQIARAMATGELITTGDEEYDREAFIDYLGKEFGYTGQVAEDMADHLVIGRDGLLQFGNALLESEGQIAAYTDTLVAGAVANSGLVDEEADIAQTYLDSRFDGIIESEKERLRSIELGDTEKEEYARIMGYTYDNGNFYSLDAEGNKVKEEGITDDLIIEQIAYSNAIKIGTGYMKNFANNISGASKKLGDGLGTLLEETYAAADGMGITKETLDNIDLSEGGDAEEKAGTIYDALFQQFGSETEAMFGTREEFVAQQIEAWNNAEQAYSNAAEKVVSTFGEGSAITDSFDTLVSDFDLTAGEAKALSNALYDVAMNGGDAAKFLNQVDMMLTGLSGEDRDRALALINSTDWTDKDSVNNTLNALEDLGVVIGDDFKQQILEATKAVKEFNMDSLNNELKAAQEALDIVKEKAENNEVTYTLEEKNALIAAGADDDEFVRTGTDEYTYLGETNTLLSLIEGHTAAILSEIAGDLEYKVKRGEEIIRAGTEESNIINPNDRYQQNFTYEEIIQRIINGGIKIEGVDENTEGYQVLSKEDLNQIATIFGIDNIDQYDTEGLKNRIIEDWQTYAVPYEQNKATWEDYNRETGTLYYSQMSGQEMLNAEDNGYKNLALDAAGVKGGSETVERATRVMLDYNKELRASGEATEVLAFRNKNMQKVAKALSYDYKQQMLAQDKLNSAIEENADALKNAEEGSDDYNKAISKITQAAQGVFGDTLSEDFVKQHDDLFLKLAEGGETAQQAYEEIGKKLAEDYVNSLNKGISATETFNAIAAGLPKDIKIGAEFDATEAINNLIALGYTAAEAAAVLESMGYTITYTTETHYIGATTGVDYGTTNPGMAMLGEGTIPTQMLVAAGVKNNAGGTGFSGGGGGGGGGGGKDDVWENPYDEFYNITEQINEELRTREQIEHDYNKLLKDRRTSIDEIRQSQLDQIASLRRELDLQQQLLEGRKRQYSEIGQETYADEEGNYKSFSEWGVTKYASYDDKTGLITIDWKSIDQITDTELGGALEAYISQIEEWSGSIEDIEDEIRDIEDQIEEIKDAEKDTYLEFEERIYEALVEADQKVIDTYQELSDTISDSNEKILNSLSESIELERQIRDNTKTEEEIADKEARLAYLRRDTSGANDLEIKQLEEELADARESYGDTLVDQELDRLNKVNEEANAQREQQIALMQAQLDWNEQNGIYWAHVDSLLEGAINSDGTFNYNSELATILEESDAFTGMSAFGKMNWINDLVEEFLTANRGFENWMVDKAEEKGMVTLADGTSLTYDDTNKVWYDKKGNTYEDIAYNSQTQSYEPGSIIKTPEPDDSGSQDNTTTPEEPEFQKPELTDGIKRGVAAAIHRGGLGWGNDPGRAEKLKEVFGADNNIQRGYVDSYKTSGFTGSVFDYSYDNMRKKFLGFKTGGLADFTGPAWLDGTKTRPELVLNQTDTQNFIQLKDILSSLLNRGSSNTQTSGDNYYNFDITVEEIGNDYDVDQMIDRVRERIYDDASYRNVNAINFLR